MKNHVTIHTRDIGLTLQDIKKASSNIKTEQISFQYFFAMFNGMKK